MLTYDQSRSVLSVKHVRGYPKPLLRKQICGSPCAVEDEEPHASAEGLCESPVHEGGEVGVEACERSASDDNLTRGGRALRAASGGTRY